MIDIVRYLKDKPLMTAIFLICLTEKDYIGASARLSIKRQFKK